MKKARNEGKSRDNYRTVKKAGGAKDVTKDKGGSKGGKVKVVDKRLKSDKRGEKRSLKKKGNKRQSSKRGKKQNKNNKSGHTSKKSVKKRR